MTVLSLEEGQGKLKYIKYTMLSFKSWVSSKGPCGKGLISGVALLRDMEPLGDGASGKSLGHLGVYPWKGLQDSIIYFSSLHSSNTHSHHDILCVRGPKATGSTNPGLKLLKLWSKINCDPSKPFWLPQVFIVVTESWLINKCRCENQRELKKKNWLSHTTY
jgi:hypothetical protein